MRVVLLVVLAFTLAACALSTMAATTPSPTPTPTETDAQRRERILEAIRVAPDEGVQEAQRVPETDRIAELEWRVDRLERLVEKLSRCLKYPSYYPC